MTNIVCLIFLKQLYSPFRTQILVLRNIYISAFFFESYFKFIFETSRVINSVLNTSFLDSLSFISPIPVNFFCFDLQLMYISTFCMHVSFLRSPWNKDLFLFNRLLLFLLPSFLPKAPLHITNQKAKHYTQCDLPLTVLNF